MTPDDSRHGTPAGYQAGCREDCCGRARSRQNARYKYLLAKGHEFTVSTERVRRKMNALRCLGWSMTDVANLLGLPKQSVTNMLAREAIRATSAEALDRAYDELHMKIPADGHIVRRTKATAKRAGHHPPLAWEDIDAGILADLQEVWDRDRLDLVLVEQCLHDGDFSRRLTVPEKREIVRRWTRSIGSERALCQLTGWREGRYAATTTNA